MAIQRGEAYIVIVDWQRLVSALNIIREITINQKDTEEYPPPQKQSCSHMSFLSFVKGGDKLQKTNKQ